jgi:signal transduction histidine kinase
MTHPFTRLRLRLTIWYVATFAVILLLLGTGLFLALTQQQSDGLDRILESTIADVRQDTDVLTKLGQTRQAALQGAVAEHKGIGAQLFLFGPDAMPLLPATPSDPRIAAAAANVLTDEETMGTEFLTPAHRRNRVRAVRILGDSGGPWALVAVTDATQLERQVQRMVETFLAVGLLALLPIGIGGYHIARVSAGRVERAMDQLRQLTSDAAHELRTPVAIIRGRAELTLERPRGVEEYETALRDVAREAAGLGRLVDDLFTLAAAEAGEAVKRRDRVFLDDLASDAVSAAAVLGTQRGVSVSLGRFEEAPVVGDAGLLRQVLMIVLDNAVKFTPAGGTVRLDVFVEDQRPTVVIEDTGIGIPSEHLPRIFDRFYRADRGRARVAGAGLGLAIARWIIEGHGARIDVSSPPQHGTRVRIRFPHAG